jgi:uncharacterized protein
MMRIWLASMLLVIALGTGAIAEDRCLEPLSITVAGGEIYTFEVEIAETFEEKARGLMHRRSLALDGGMLFVFTKELRQSMWMKNTLIPLDMLFIRQNGRIAHIHERAVPGSLATISSRGRVLAVLELRGGTAARLGIRKGDRVAYTIFKD